MAIFVALDFETADRGRDSACSLAIVRVEGARITAREHRFIRLPRREFEFTYIHGISWRDVKDQPTFAPVWHSINPLLACAKFIAAYAPKRRAHPQPRASPPSLGAQTQWNNVAKPYCVLHTW